MTTFSPAIHGAINDCYSSLTDQQGWSNALHSLALSLGADAACFYAEDAANLRLSFPASPRYQNFLEEFVKAGWWRTDHRALRGWPRLRGGNRVLVDHDLVTDKERQGLAVYHDLYTKHDLTWWAAVSFRVGDRDWAMPILRAEAKTPFGAEARFLLELVPHLSRIVGIGTAMMAAGTLDAVEMFELGRRPAVSVDWSGRCIALNARAEGLLGRDLFIAGGHLRATDASSDAQLQSFVHAALQARSMAELPPAVTIRRAGRMPVVVDAITTSNALSRGGFTLQRILLLTDLEQASHTGPAMLRQVFGFTQAEARLAEQLSAGHTLAQASEQLGLSLETARTQLKTIFARTGTHRQADLLRLLDRASLAVGRP